MTGTPRWFLPKGCKILADSAYDSNAIRKLISKQVSVLIKPLKRFVSAENSADTGE